MFTQPRSQIVEGLRRLRFHICSCFQTDPYSHRPCDCKYGGPKSGKDKYQGEETGCPEVGSAIILLEAMTDQEYEIFCKKAKLILLTTSMVEKILNPEVKNG